MTINKTILISGITGQDGVFLSSKLIKKFNVVGIVRPGITNSKIQKFLLNSNINKATKINLEEVNLLNQNDTNDIIKKYKPEFFYHLASQSSVEKSFVENQSTLDYNFFSTKNIIDSIKENSKDTKFFFPTSCTVFEGYANLNVDENTNPKPMSPYAVSKYKSQEMLKAYNHEYDLNINIGLMFSHESKFRKDNYFTMTVVNHIIRYKYFKKDYIYVGNLNLTRDIGSAEEYVDAIIKINQSNNKGIYIVSRNDLYKLQHFVNLVCDSLDLNFSVEENGDELMFIDKSNNKIFLISSDKKSRQYEIDGIKGNNTKIFKDLNWEPKKNLEDIVEEMVSFKINEIYKS